MNGAAQYGERKSADHLPRPVIDPPREPARLDVQHFGQLRDSLKTRLAAYLFPLAHVPSFLRWIKRCSDCGLAHLPRLAGGAESVTEHRKAMLDQQPTGHVDG